MAEKPKAKAASKTKTTGKPGLPFGKRNYAWFGIALASIVIGYIFLANGDITVAPILLVLGYCVLVPIAILLPPERKTKTPVGREVTETPASVNK